MTIVTTSANGSLNGSGAMVMGGAGSQPPAAAGAGAKGSGSVDPMRVLRKHKVTLAVAAFVGAVLGVGGHFALAEFRPTWSTPVIYKCYPPQAEVNPEQGMIDDEEFERFMATEAAMMTSENVLRRAVENPRLINEAPDWIDQYMRGGVVDVALAAKGLEEQVNARPISGTDLVRFSVSWRDREEVATLAGVLKDTYLQDLRRRGSRATSEQRETLQQAIRDIEDQRSEIQRKRNEIVSTKGLDALQVNVSQERAELNLVMSNQQELGLQMQAIQSQMAEMEAQLRNPGGLQYNDMLRFQVENSALVQNLRSQVIILETQRDAQREQFGEGHVSIRRIDDQVAALRKKMEQERERLLRENFETQLDQLRIAAEQTRAQLEQLATRRSELGQRLTELVLAENELTKLEADEYNLSELMQEFETDLRMVEATSKLSTASRVEVIQSERIPTVMAFPKLYIMIPAGIFLVGGLAAGVVFLLEIVDQRVKSPADLASLPAVRVLGMIPHAAEDPSSISSAERVFADSPTSTLAESYRQVRATIAKRMRAGGHRSLLVVPAMPGSGATSVASNLAMALAAADCRVVLIDANLRRPHLHEVFGLPQGPGLSDLLAGARFADIVRQTSRDNLRLVTAGEADERRLEALAAGSIGDLLALAGEQADMVIVDVAPATVAGDAQAMAQVVDATVLVARAFGETRGQIGRLSREFGEQPSEYLGVLVNAARGASGGYLRGNIRASHSYLAKPRA